MSAFSLEKLLVLQERDRKRLLFEQQLTAVPHEIAAIESKIATEKSAIETAKAEWHGLEAKKKTLETEIKSAEEKIDKYKNQQMQVRKNDEYQALTHEIATMQTAIGKMEEEEIGIMLQIDEAKAKFKTAEAVLKNNISGHEGKIRALRERGTHLESDVKEAQGTVTLARGEVADSTLRVYDRIAIKPGHPVCAAITAGKCGGCHLKVPIHIEVQARAEHELTTCDQCGRIVFLEK